MTKVGLIKFLLIIFLIPAVHAQRIKYKDIFGLLSTKQYDQAEPFLNKYLQQNDDNPNAFLFMGMIYQEKSQKGDILKQTGVVLTNIDSAVYFFDKARKTIDDREIRKNKEYYQSYNRRDLRTGEFGVKLSDVQFDIEKRMEGLRERKDRVQMVKFYFNFADSLYKKSNSLYRSIQEPHSSVNELYLQSSDSTLLKLNALSVRFDSTVKFTENYIASVQNVGSTNYKPALKLNDVVDFKKDGVVLADFYENEIQLWNYKKFATQSREIIEKEILPMREHLLSFDAELNKLGEKLKNDSVSVRSDLTRLTEKLLSEQIMKFDSDPLPLNVFGLKMADLEYKSVILENETLGDTADVHLQLKQSLLEKAFLDKLDSLADKLVNEDLANTSINYHHFITNTFNSNVILKSYVKGLKEYAVREKARLQKELFAKEKAIHWVVVDSAMVPLFADSVVSQYKPLIVEQEKYTLGLTYADSSNVRGYFYSITPSRRPDIKVNFPVDKSNFMQDEPPAIKAFATDANNMIYYVLIYSAGPVSEKYPSTLAKIYRSDGLSWTNNLQLEFEPTEILYNQETGELLIKGSDKALAIDKNGKTK